MIKIAEAKTNTLENFYFVIAALCESVRKWNFQRIQDFGKPVVASGNTRLEFNKRIILTKSGRFSSHEPIRKLLFGSFSVIFSVHDIKELVFQTISFCQKWSIFKNNGKFLYFLLGQFLFIEKFSGMFKICTKKFEIFFCSALRTDSIAQITCRET